MGGVEVVVKVDMMVEMLVEWKVLMDSN